jgi:hypothetical protein
MGPWLVRARRRHEDREHHSNHEPNAYRKAPGRRVATQQEQKEHDGRQEESRVNEENTNPSPNGMRRSPVD